MQQRRIIIQSKLESKALYGASILFNESENIKKRFEGVIMRLNKWIYGGNTYRKHYKDICNEIKVEPSDQKILKANTKYIMKVILEKEVAQIFQFLKTNERLGTKIYMRDPLKTQSKGSLDDTLVCIMLSPLR